MRRAAVYVFSPAGLALGRRIAPTLGEFDLVAIHAAASVADADSIPFAGVKPLLAETFDRFQAHIFIGAMGIAVRAVAPLIRNKTRDPAVLVVDDLGRWVIPVLSGHLGGANDLALALAAKLGAIPVVTTATDGAGLAAPDLLARRADLIVENPAAIRSVNAALLRGDVPTLFDPEERLGAPAEWPRSPNPPTAGPAVLVSDRVHPAADPAKVLVLRPRSLALGLGCARGKDAQSILHHIEKTFAEAGLSPNSVARAGSIEAKRDEAGLVQAIRSLALEPTFFTAPELAAVAVPNPSPTVAAHMGTASVAEATAILLARGGDLLVGKTKTDGVTLAVARIKAEAA